MREITVEQLGKGTEQFVGAAAKENVLLTRQGRPLALVIPLENYDEEDLAYMTSHEFWEMIHQRRQETQFVTLEQAEAELAADLEKENSSHTQN